jgi:hypothetical protein
VGGTGFLGEQRLEEGVQSLRWVGQGSWGSRGWFRRKGYRVSGGWDRVPIGAEDGLEEGVQSLRWVGQGSWGSRGMFRGKGTEPQLGGTGFLGEQRLV